MSAWGDGYPTGCGLTRSGWRHEPHIGCPGYDGSTPVAAPAAPHDELPEPLVPAETSAQIRMEQAKLADTLRALGETVEGHRAYLISQGWPEEYALQLAAQLHALISFRWFGVPS